LSLDIRTKLFLKTIKSYKIIKSLSTVKYLQHSQINKEKWDTCIEQSPQAVIYAHAFYLDIVSPFWEAIVEEENGNYLTVMPLTWRKKYGITFLHQPIFCQQLGLFSIAKEISMEKIGQFFHLLFETYPFIPRYQWNVHNTRIFKNLHQKDFVNLSGESIFLQKFSHKHLTFFTTHHLSLSQPYSVLYQNYSKDRKMNLKRAKKAHLEIIESEDMEPLLAMFEKDIAQKLPKGVAPNAYELFREIYMALKERKWGKLFYTKNTKGEIKAGALFVFYQNQIIYLFNACYQEARKENGRTLLIDHIIQNYANSTYTFDFESPEIERIAYFYKSFGAEEILYPALLNYNQLPFWVNVLWKVKKYFQ
jgi:hypothetical protein